MFYEASSPSLYILEGSLDDTAVEEEEEEVEAEGSAAGQDSTPIQKPYMLN